MKPLDATAIPVDTSDEQLVASAQAGSSEAFAVLFRRYKPAIARYAGRLLGDDVRAEDIVQEVFLSALRSIDSLDRPAGFKPWLYRIAHNTCVDHVRRNGRAEEVSMDAAVLPVNEEIRLFRQAPSTHAAVTQKEDFRNLREAFRGLPPSQSEVLVMRELEGLSYDEIAARLGVSRGAVESMLFRARQGLRDEYGEIATGQRCLRMRQVMARMAEGLGGLRDRRALARHVRGCQPCRRDAFAMGLGGPALESPVTGLRGGLSRVAALLPLPWLIYRRTDGTDAASSAGGGGGTFAVHAQNAVTHMSTTMSVSADHAATGIQKAVAVVAAVAVVGGGGLVAGKSSTDRDDLLLKSGQATTPVHTDAVTPATPPALLPLGHQRVVGGAPAAAGALVAPLATTTPATGGPVLAPAAGAPGLTTPILPETVLPAPPSNTGAGGGDGPAASAPEGAASPEASIPAASEPPSSGSGSGDGGGSAGGGGSGDSGGSGSGGSSGSGSGSNSDGGSASSGGSSGDSGGVVTAPPAPAPTCDPPRGLDKKDKLPPGWAKKCGALESAAESPAP